MAHLVRKTRVVVATQVDQTAFDSGVNTIENDDDIVILVPLQGTSSYFTLWLPEEPIIGQTHSIVIYDETSFIHSIGLNTRRHRFANMANNPGDIWDLGSTGKKMTLVYAEVPARLNNIPGSNTLNGSPLGLCGTCMVSSGSTVSTITNFNPQVGFVEYNVKPGDTFVVYDSFGPPVICEKRRVLSVDSNDQITVENIGSSSTIQTLNGTISSGASSLVVSSASGFPTPPFRIRIDSEVLEVHNAIGNTFYVYRAQDGTTSTSHGSGSFVYLGKYWQAFINEGLWFPINL